MVRVPVSGAVWRVTGNGYSGVPGAGELVNLIEGLPGDDKGLVVHATESNRAVTMRMMKAYVEGLASGQKPAVAAAAAGTTPKALRRGGRRVREAIDRLTEDYVADAGTLKQLVTLSWTELALESVDPKLRLAALRELASIPEVGLKNGPGRSAVPEEILDPETLRALEAE